MSQNPQSLFRAYRNLLARASGKKIKPWGKRMAAKVVLQRYGMFSEHNCFHLALHPRLGDVPFVPEIRVAFEREIQLAKYRYPIRPLPDPVRKTSTRSPGHQAGGVGSSAEGGR